MVYFRFKTEEELLKEVYRSLKGKWVYPRVTDIDGNKIWPDIDILQINDGWTRAIGYEIKLMKPSNKSASLNYEDFYTGISQALLYLKNGVHRAYLVLGFHENTNDYQINEFLNWLSEKKELLKSIVGSHVSIGTYLEYRGSISPIIEAESDFYTSDEEVKLLSNKLLKGKFSFNQKLFWYRY